MSSHTPGPWEVRHARESGSFTKDWREVWAGRHCVVSPSGFQRSYDGEAETVYGVRISDADANLIAAAPEMLAALKMVAEMAVEWKALSPGDIREVMAVIKKAEPDE